MEEFAEMLLVDSANAPSGKPPEKSEVDLRWLECPWLLDFLATGEQTKAKGPSSTAFPDSHKHDVDALMVMDALYAAREDWQLHGRDDTEDFKCISQVASGRLRLMVWLWARSRALRELQRRYHFAMAGHLQSHRAIQFHCTKSKAPFFWLVPGAIRCSLCTTSLFSREMLQLILQRPWRGILSLLSSQIGLERPPVGPRRERGN